MNCQEFLNALTGNQSRAYRVAGEVFVTEPCAWPKRNELFYINVHIICNKSTFWVTGGIGKDYSEMSSTEMINLKEERSMKSPINLPKSLQLHCLVKINEKQILLIGGLRCVLFHLC